MKTVLLLSLAVVGGSAFAAAPAAPAPAAPLMTPAEVQLNMKLISDVAGVFAKCDARYGQIAVAAVEKVASEASKTTDPAVRQQIGVQVLSEALAQASTVAPSVDCIKAGTALVASGSEAAKLSNPNAFAMVQDTLVAMARANAQASAAAAKPKKQ